MMLKTKPMLSKFLATVCFVGFSTALWAQPIVIEGAVPNETTKQEILNKAYLTYGQENVVDKIQVQIGRASCRERV